MERLAVFGDIHGDVAALDSLLRVALQHSNRLVFLGDYVNRGLQSREVIERLVGLSRQSPESVFLRGNHDLAFQKALDGDLESFLVLGGARTVRSYVDPPYPDPAVQFRAAVPPDHRRFLENLADSYSDQETFVAHWADLRQDPRFVITGHSPSRSFEPHVSEAGARIDTGCGTLHGGRLTCFFWPSRTWIQAESTTVVRSSSSAMP